LSCAHPDAHEYLQSLVWQTVTTLSGRPNTVLAIGDDNVYVGDVLAVEAELLRSEGIDPAWPGCRPSTAAAKVNPQDEQ
jgi:hypothetical protein